MLYVLLLNVVVCIGYCILLLCVVNVVIFFLFFVLMCVLKYVL